MANYTIELGELIDKYHWSCFDFYYPFYTDDTQAKQEFEQLFKDVYYFHEIGYETPDRFKQQLKAKLTLKMPYYKQLFYSELKSKEIDFLLNKDLRETHTKTMQGESDQSIKADNTQNLTQTSGTQTEGKTTTNEQTQDWVKESRINDGVSSASMKEGYLTSISQNDHKGDVSQNHSTNETGEVTNHVNGTGNTQSQSHSTSTEIYEFISRGNIGVTSSAELLEKWRSVMINLNEIIVNDCKSLFLQIY